MGASEVSLGNAIKRGIDEGKWKRTDWVISTKLYKSGNGVNELGLSRKHIIEGLKGSLKRLQLEYVDLVYAHRYDRLTPMEEVVRGFNYLLDNGLAFYWGTSEWAASQIADAHSVSRQYNLIPPTMEQPQYNLLVRDRVEHEYLPLFKREQGLGITSYSPLKSGILTGKYNEGVPSDSRMAKNAAFFQETLKKLTSTPEGAKELETVKKLSEYAKELGLSVSQLSIAWVVKNENVSSCILGGSKLDQVKENIEALKFVSKLTPEVLAKIESIVNNKPVAPSTGPLAR